MLERCDLAVAGPRRENPTHLAGLDIRHKLLEVARSDIGAIGDSPQILDEVLPVRMH